MGRHFRQLCNPFWPCTGLMCCHCGDFYPTSKFVWTETGEAISSFRKRLRRATPLPAGLWRIGLGQVVGLTLGTSVANRVVSRVNPKDGDPVLLYLVLLISITVLTYVLVSYLFNKYYGIDYSQEA